MVMLGGVAVAILLHNPHENVGFDPRIYVAEKEGCLFESETRSLGFLQNPEKGNTRHEYGQDKPTGEFPPPKSIYSTDAIA